MLWDIIINTLPGLSSGEELLLVGHVSSYKWWMLKEPKKGGKNPRDKSFIALGREQRCVFLPCRAVSYSVDFGLALPMPFLLHSLGRKWYFPAGMLPWLDLCVANVCLIFFHLISMWLCWQLTTIFYLQPHQGAAHPWQVLLCQCSMSMAAHSLGSHCPGSHLHKLILCHSETPVLLWITHHPTISSLFLEIQTRKLRVFPHFLLLIFWWSKL